MKKFCVKNKILEYILSKKQLLYIIFELQLTETPASIIR